MRNNLIRLVFRVFFQTYLNKYFKQLSQFHKDFEKTFPIINNEKIIKEKGFSEAFSYKNLDNKFDLYEYEIDVQNDIIKKITEELIIYLNI